MENGVKILKASAGSGKTYALAKEYIRLLLGKEREPNMHRHILAVTFTNKATGEMKARIIEELSTLAHNPQKSGYREDLLKDCGYKSLEELQKAADTALSAILNDYGAFSVSTIDKFFQQTLRAFSREAGQFCEYQIELDKPSLVSEAVDRVLDSLSEGHSDLLKWLSDNALDQIEAGEGYHLESNLGSFAKGYMTTSYDSKVKENGIDEQKAFSPENLQKLKDICRQIAEKYDKEFVAAAKDALQFLETFPEFATSPSVNFKKRLVEFTNYKPGKEIRFHESATVWLNAVSDGRKAFTKAAGDRLSQSDADAIRDRLVKVAAFGERPYQIRRTVFYLQKQVALFRVADALNQEFKALLKEKNVLSLDDTNSILRDIIGGTDIPFIYEKTGVRYHHFLLDEFQDTSLVQWENFLPLLRNSIAENFANLVVGDVKQSIYRWREADWKILDSRVQSELDRAKEVKMSENWRSAPAIVDFNNKFYAMLAKQLDDSIGELRGVPSDKRIEGIYSDVKQTAKKKFTVPGSVELTFCESKQLYDQTVDAVVAAHDRGFDYKDIAVTVRTNAMGANIASKLISAGIPVVSNDSLRICAGNTVRRLVSQLFYLDNPEDKVNTFYAGEFSTECLSACNSLVETADALLRQMPSDEVNDDTLYVLAFMDLLRDFTAHHGNSLHAFLQYWKEDGMKNSIYSPEESNAVTIITIHRVKGLDYPFVIIPFAKKEALLNDRETSWELPDLADTPLDQAEKALYNIKMSGKLVNTLFADNYKEAAQMEYIDSINLAYVATTRASQAMHIIVPGATDKALNLRNALHQFALDSDNQAVKVELPEGEGDSDSGTSETEAKIERYYFGEIKDFDSSVKKSRDNDPGRMPLQYLLCETGRVGQLKVKGDAKEFFDSENHNVFDKSRRIRGTVLHAIMQSIIGPADIQDAVSDAVSQGRLPREDKEFAVSVISRAVESVLQRGWFPGESTSLLDERSICDESGEVHRPDRVVIKPDGSVDIIDYKFGDQRSKYLTQVRNYAELYRRLGYSNVNAYVWYVEAGKIVEA